MINDKTGKKLLGFFVGGSTFLSSHDLKKNNIDEKCLNEKKINECELYYSTDEAYIVDRFNELIENTNTIEDYNYKREFDKLIEEIKEAIKEAIKFKYITNNSIEPSFVPSKYKGKIIYKKNNGKFESTKKQIKEVSVGNPVKMTRIQTINNGELFNNSETPAEDGYYIIE